MRTCIVDEDPGYTPDDHQIETHEMQAVSTRLQHAALVSGREELVIVEFVGLLIVRLQQSAI